MIKACYIQHGSEYGIMKGLAENFIKDNIELVFVARSNIAYAQYKKDGFEAYSIADALNEKIAVSQKELLDLDLKYGPRGIRSICDSDNYLRFFANNRTKQENLIARAYKFWESFLEKNKIDYLLAFNETGLFATGTAYNVARARGIPRGTINCGPGREHFTLNDVGETYCWSELLEAVKNGPRKLTEDQRKVAMDFVEKRIGKKPGAVNMHFISANVFTRLREFAGLWKMAIEANLRGDLFSYGVVRAAIYRLIKRSWWKYFTRNFIKYDSPKNESYVYFPLFCEYESGNLVNYRYWTNNQSALIHEIAQNLPVGVKLYVKEHPEQPGEFSFRRLKNMQDIRGVKIIHPSVSGQELIRNCQASIILDGTSGWESYLMRKPVITLGSAVYFNYSPLIYKVGRPEELSRVIFQAVKRGSSIYSENEDEWIWFIYSVITTCGKAPFRGGSVLPEDVVDKEGAYRAMAEYIGKKIHKQVSLIKAT